VRGGRPLARARFYIGCGVTSDEVYEALRSGGFERPPEEACTYVACYRACARAAWGWHGWVDAIDAVDVCRRECRGVAAELVRQDVKAGVKLLRDLLKRAGIVHEVDAKADAGAVVRLRL
jgi:hypothetical protein